MTHKAFVKFLHLYGNHGEEYRIRFNKTAARLFDGVNRVDIGKTENYIVVFPLDNNSAFGVNLSRDRYGSPSISLTKLIKSHGFLHKDLFDGTRYAVRRGKTGDNKIYICLKERIEDDGKGQGDTDPPGRKQSPTETDREVRP